MRSPTAFYITRANHWSFEERERVPIAEDEWLTYLAGDPEFQLVEMLPAVNLETGDVIELPVAGEGLWEWTGYSRRAEISATFQHNRGGIIVRATDPEVLRKARSVATVLKAQLLGDDMP